MAINDLPGEILVRILSFLPPSDRLSCALTCRRWAREFAAPELMRDIWFTSRGVSMSEIEDELYKSYRQYENIRLEVPLLQFNVAFWTKFGPRLRKLELIGCRWSPEAFYAILQACSNLESLGIRNHEESPAFNFEMPPGLCLQSIQRSLRNLRHLHLDFPVNADMLELLLVSMPNVSSIGLSQFDQRSDFLSRLPSILGTSRELTVLDLNATFEPSDNECKQLLRISSASLRKFEYSLGFSRGSSFEALRNCTMLRHLDVRIKRYIYGEGTDGLLRNILQNMPELETLSLRDSYGVGPCTSGALSPISGLQKLRKLRLDLYLGFCRGFLLSLKGKLSLETFILGERMFVDSFSFEKLTSLPNLRNLEIYGLIWDYKCLNTILFNSRKLSTLVISGPISFAENRELLELELKNTASGDHSFPDRRNDLESSSLEALEVVDMPLTNACLDRIARSHGRLKVFSCECADVTDAGIVAFLQQEPLLEKLTIGCFKAINDRILEALGELCPRLRLVHFYAGTKISSSALEAFKLRKPWVKVIC